MIGNVEVDWEDLSGRLEHAETILDSVVTEVVYRTGAGLQTLIRQKATTGYHPPGEGHIPGTGPGPNVATGDYRRSIALTTGREGGVPTSLVSTNAPQARRLEYGFPVPMVDSLGRSFNQPPYPHWRPAVEETRPRFIADMTGAIKEAFQ